MKCANLQCDVSFVWMRAIGMEIGSMVERDTVLRKFDRRSPAGGHLSSSSFERFLFQF